MTGRDIDILNESYQIINEIRVADGTFSENDASRPTPRAAFDVFQLIIKVPYAHSIVFHPEDFSDWISIKKWMHHSGNVPIYEVLTSSGLNQSSKEFSLEQLRDLADIIIAEPQLFSQYSVRPMR